MERTKQFIAIGTQLGWELVEFDGTTRWKRDGKRTPGVYPPEYLDDLNAAAAAENQLLDPPNPKFVAEWERHIRQITLRDGREGSGLYERIIRATAAQRIEALLRALGEWQD